MIRDITIGQFYPADSILHRLDPRVKIIGTLLYLICLFLVKDFLAYGFIFLCLAALIKVSKVPVKFMLKGLKSIMIIIVFTAALNLISHKEGTVLCHVWKFTVTTAGVEMAIKMCIRLMMLIVGSSLLTLTTTPIRLTDGIESLLRPLKKIGLPAHEIAMMMTIALRFIPTLLDETDKIMKAQQARGADFSSGSLFTRAKSLVPILVPLFISAFRRAEELAMAMEARCYRGDEGRTRMKEMKLKGHDAAAVVVMIVYLAAILVLRKVLV